MKRITLFFLAAVCAAGSLNAQRISSMTVTGVPSLVPFAAFNPTTNSTTTIGDGQIVFAQSADLSNIAVSFNCGTAAAITEPASLPSDWSAAVSGIKVTSTTPNATTGNYDWALYNVTTKKIKPAALPFEVKTGSGNFSSDSWTNTTVGWAGACIDKAQTLIRFGSAGRSFVVAFTDAPDSLYYTIKSLGTWSGSNNVFDVDGSADGQTWTSICKYDASNLMPGSSPATIAKIKLPDTKIRYIRWIYSVRNTGTASAFNVSLENVKVTKSSVPSAVLTPEEQQVKLAVIPGTDQLMLTNAEQVKKVVLFDLAGAQVAVKEMPGEKIQVAGLRSGVYVARLTFNSGSVTSVKLMKK